MFRKRGLAVSVLLTLIVLTVQGLYFCEDVRNFFTSLPLILALGITVGLYHLKGEEYEACQQYSMAWHEKVQRRLYEKTRHRFERDKQLATLSDFAQRVALCADIEDVIHSGLDLVQETMDVDAVLIFSLQESSGELNLLASKGLYSERGGAWQADRPGEGINGIVVQSGRPLIAYNEEHYFTGFLKDEGFRALAVVPLITRSKIIGTLTVAVRRQHIFSVPEVNVLETLGNQLGLAMENDMLSDEQKIMRQQLHESEKQYSKIFEKTNDIIWVEDLDGHIISANKACAKMMGVEHPQLIEKSFFSFIPPESVKKAATIRQQLLDGMDVEKSYDQAVINSRGAEIILKVTSNLIEFSQKKGFQHIGKDITEEKKMQENLQFYIQQTTRAQEEERLRISRELHDSTAQSLIVVLHQLENFLVNNKHLLLSDSRFLYYIAEQVKSVLQEVRHFSRDLRPSILDDLGLVPSLEWYIDELNRDNTTRTVFQVKGKELRLLPDVEVNLFRIVQEALRNVVRHANAAGAKVSVYFQDHEVSVAISDNGKGFDSKPLGDLLRHGKLGLAGMHERVKLLGGKIDIDSKEGVGTTLYITIPTDRVAAAQSFRDDF
jgi:two-component system sensor histidine kinase DegS